MFGVIQAECGGIRTRITPNTDTFDAVALIQFPYKMMRWKVGHKQHQDEV